MLGWHNETVPGVSTNVVASIAFYRDLRMPATEEVGLLQTNGALSKAPTSPEQVDRHRPRGSPLAFDERRRTNREPTALPWHCSSSRCTGRSEMYDAERS